jgi:hypothetical protein
VRVNRTCCARIALAAPIYRVAVLVVRDGLLKAVGGTSMLSTLLNLVAKPAVDRIRYTELHGASVKWMQDL